MSHGGYHRRTPISTMSFPMTIHASILNLLCAIEIESEVEDCPAKGFSGGWRQSRKIEVLGCRLDDPTGPRFHRNQCGPFLEC